MRLAQAGLLATQARRLSPAEPLSSTGPRLSLLLAVAHTPQVLMLATRMLQYKEFTHG